MALFLATLSERQLRAGMNEWRALMGENTNWKIIVSRP
jgi:hypothetical protein